MIPDTPATRGLAMLALACLWLSVLFWGFSLITTP